MRVAWDQDRSCVGGEKQSDSGYILRMEPVGCAHKVDVDMRKNDVFTSFGVSN